MSNQFSGTKEVAENLAFSLDNLNKYLLEKAINISLISECKQFKGGQSNPTYLLTGNGKNYVLRRKPPGKLLKSAHAVDREYRVISALRIPPYQHLKLTIFVRTQKLLVQIFTLWNIVMG